MNKKLYEQAIQFWGKNFQIVVAVEECGELIHALTKYLRNGPIGRFDVAEEIADVEIMLEQLKVIFGERDVEYWKKEKLSRLKEMLKEEQK